MMMKRERILSYRDLEAWQKAMDLVIGSYRLTRQFPKNEQFGLASQMQRAAVSIPANIAEGQARQHTKEYLQHLSIANGSLAELETHAQIAERLKYLNSDQVEEFLTGASTVGRLVNGLRRALGRKSSFPTPSH